MPAVWSSSVAVILVIPGATGDYLPSAVDLLDLGDLRFRIGHFDVRIVAHVIESAVFILAKQLGGLRHGLDARPIEGRLEDQADDLAGRLDIANTVPSPMTTLAAMTIVDDTARE